MEWALGLHNLMKLSRQLLNIFGLSGKWKWSRIGRKKIFETGKSISREDLSNWNIFPSQTIQNFDSSIYDFHVSEQTTVNESFSDEEISAENAFLSLPQSNLILVSRLMEK